MSGGFSIVIYESSISTFSFFCLVYKLFKSDLKIINLILGIFKFVDCGYIKGYLLLSYIEKLISTFDYFISYFLLVLVFSFMESSIPTILYIFSLFLVIKLHNFSPQILHFFSGYLIFLGSVDFGGYSIVAYFER